MCGLGSGDILRRDLSAVVGLILFPSSAGRLFYLPYPRL